jgi:AAA+ ATPase superfamily predicted ATPase
MALPETLPFSLPFFVGREKELGWLEDRVFIQEWSHRPIFITGFVGIGKTALLREFFNSIMNRTFHLRP